MKLDQLDIMAVAKSRVSRMESKATSKWMWGMVVGWAIGALLYFKVNIGAGCAVIFLSICAFLYYNNTLGKKQKIEQDKMIREWQEENKQEVK